VANATHRFRTPRKLSSVARGRPDPDAGFGRTGGIEV